MVLACWWSVSAAVVSLFLAKAAAMQGEHCYVLTSLLIVYAGQHAAFKAEIGAIQCSSRREGRFAQRSYKLAKASQEPVRDPSSPRWRFGGLLAKITKTGSS